MENPHIEKFDFGKLLPLLEELAALLAQILAKAPK